VTLSDDEFGVKQRLITPIDMPDQISRYIEIDVTIRSSPSLVSAYTDNMINKQLRDFLSFP